MAFCVADGFGKMLVVHSAMHQGLAHGVGVVLPVPGRTYLSIAGTRDSFRYIPPPLVWYGVWLSMNSGNT
jgi:hypothetical protein